MCRLELDNAIHEYDPSRAASTDSTMAIESCTCCSPVCSFCHGAFENSTARENTFEYLQRNSAVRSSYTALAYDNREATWCWPSTVDAGYRIGPILSSKARSHQYDDKHIHSAHDALATLQFGKRKRATIDWACESEVRSKRQQMDLASNDLTEDEDEAFRAVFSQDLHDMRSKSLGSASPTPLAVEDAGLLLGFSNANM